VGRARVTRYARGVIALSVALAAAPWVSPAGAQTPAPEIEVRNGVTQPVFSYRDAIRETVYVQSSIDGDDDGDLDLLATDIIRPRETNDGLRVPVIYEQSPYYQTLGRGNESEVKGEEDGDFVPEVFPLFYDNYFVPRGYAVVLQDMPGTRNSEGCMALGGLAEPLAAKATIDWLNGRGTAFDGAGNEVQASWSTGQTGMIGKSYDGSVANGAAALGVDGLETIVPIGGISRWYDYHLNNGVQYANAYTTPGLFSFVIDQQPSDDEERAQEWVENTFTENSTCTAKGAEIVAKAGDPQGDYNDFWDERDYLKDVENVTASVFVAHGLNDWNVKPNNYVRWFQELGRQGVERKIWLAQSGHVDPFEFRRKAWVRTLHRWFDRWLHDIDNGIEDEPIADIERNANRWKTYRSWPDRRARMVSLRFGPKKGKRPGVLSLRRSKGRQSFQDDPDQGESEMISGRRQTKANRLIFITRRLRRPVRISGRIKVDIRAAVDRVDTNFTGLLIDYGKARRVDHEGSGEGVTTTSKESCHGQSTAADDACYFITRKNTAVNRYETVSRGWLDARHNQSRKENNPLEPNRRYRFRWEIFGDDYIFKKGHRIGIVIAGSDADWTIPDPEEANITVFLRRSRVVLPIVGGASAYRRSKA
jgi:X-Pro dipeptidyl-peptidase